MVQIIYYFAITNIITKVMCYVSYLNCFMSDSLISDKVLIMQVIGSKVLLTKVLEMFLKTFR